MRSLVRGSGVRGAGFRCVKERKARGRGLRPLVRGSGMRGAGVRCVHRVRAQAAQVVEQVLTRN